MAADETINGTGLQRRQDGSSALPSGGTLDFESGSVVKFAGTDRTNQLAKAAQAMAAGVKVAYGEVTLDGSNPTSVAALTTGLATIIAAVACIKSSSALGDDPIAVSVSYENVTNPGRLDIYANKTDGTDPTLVASTNNTAVVSWIAIGT